MNSMVANILSEPNKTHGFDTIHGERIQEIENKQIGKSFFLFLSVFILGMLIMISSFSFL